MAWIVVGVGSLCLWLGFWAGAAFVHRMLSYDLLEYLFETDQLARFVEWRCERQRR